MINSDNLINDGLDNCKNNHQTTWTYNQGVILGGLADLAAATNNNTLLRIGQEIADHSKTHIPQRSFAGAVREWWLWE